MTASATVFCMVTSNSRLIKNQTTTCTRASSPAIGRSIPALRFQSAKKDFQTKTGESFYILPTLTSKAFQRYAGYYLSTNGQIYWSDTHQLSIYPANYHRRIDRSLHARQAATEIITEINVPRDSLESFLSEV